jgi:uncharacterized protein (DUF2141 family)
MAGRPEADGHAGIRVEFLGSAGKRHMRGTYSSSARGFFTPRRGAAAALAVGALVVLTAVPLPALSACEGARASVLVRVNGVRSSRGFVVATLYGDQPDDFLKKGKRLARERVAARTGQVDVCVLAPGPGIYALAVFHDENGDMKLDRSWLGLPSEGYGLSNNPPPAWRWPRHSDSAFRVAGERVILDVDLRYGTDGASFAR